MKTIYFITGNKGKFFEVKEKLKNLDITVVQKNLGYPEVQGVSLKEVAGYGVDHIKKRFPHPFIIEDAGLFVDALEGFPGVYSKYVFFTIGCKGILKLLEDKKRRTAIFKSVYAYSESNKKPLFFIGECIGTIANKERGEGGFGYDPIFIPNVVTKTFAEMSTEEKNTFSHRGKALEEFIKFLKEK
ncbi:MAG: XTP/dITP diphosphatase [Thermoplasmatales archaeon]|nr:MAG: XTP/dITP diphosphatase [Thermoplasmatales archaeon]